MIQDEKQNLLEADFKQLSREQRELLIAQKYRITRTDKGYVVPSQFNKGQYLVKVRYDHKECNCPDFETRRQKCKHIFAVEYTLQKDIDTNGNTIITEIVKKTYPQNWKAYNISQQTEKQKLMELLADITSRIRQPAYTFGRPKGNLGDNFLLWFSNIFYFFRQKICY